MFPFDINNKVGRDQKVEPSFFYNVSSNIGD